MSVNPCNVCGGTDLNLVDGFYYCVECGTQDVNVQETVVEHTVLADGTFAHAASRKLAVVQDGIEMSGEWNKWHAYNFVLAGLVDELIALGAQPSVRMKVLWVWTRYIKMFQVKEEMDQTKNLLDDEDRDTTQIEDAEKDNQNDNNSEEERNPANKQDDIEKTSKRKHCKDERNDITIVTKGLLLAILYVALNLDHSDILLCHLERYIREGRLNIFDCVKYVPKELDKKSIPNWRNFRTSTLDYFAPNYIRSLAMTCFKKLDLGTPLVPDMRQVIDTYVTELCLPKEFKNLVFSLMNLIPCDFLQIDSRSKKTSVRIPDFEVVGMSYVLIALKLCFGLDDDYEIRLSDAVDKINEEENLAKSFKLGFSEPSERLFSFREWCNYLQFRKIMLCKHYLPMSRQHNLEVDDHVFMEQLGERRKRKIELSDQLMMDILNKIPLDENVGVIPKAEFFATLTPMSTYTDVIVKYIQDPDFSLLLSEDFSQYSLKYACEDLALPTRVENLVRGVSEDNKTVNPVITGTLAGKQADFTMVYIRNCENKNWLKTKPPTVEHVTKIDKTEGSDKDSDHGYDSNIENTPVETDLNATENADTQDELVIKRKLELIEEGEENTSLETNLSDTENANKQDEPEIESKIKFIEEEKNTSVGINLNASENGDIQNELEIERNLEFIEEEEENTLVETNLNASDNADIQDELEIERKLEFIEEEDEGKNIFDDDFYDLDNDLKKEITDPELDRQDDSRTLVDRFEFENDNDDNLLDSKFFQDDDDDNVSRSTEHRFNPETFDRKQAIKELILSACKKYRIPKPVEYNPKEPRKRKTNLIDDEAGAPRPKRKRSDDVNIRKRGETKQEIDKLLNSYYKNQENDILKKVSEHVKAVVHNFDKTDLEFDETINRIDNESHVFDDTLIQNDVDIDPRLNNEENNQNTEDPSIAEVIEPSILETNSDNEEIENLISKDDPDFDEKTHHIKQLYVKFKEKIDTEDIFELEDPGILKILDEKIEEFTKGEVIKLRAADLKPQKTYASDSDDDIPLIVYQQEKKLMRDKKKQSKEKLEPLIKNTEHLKEFKYWFRHYSAPRMKKSLDVHQKFDTEIKENCPKSLNFVLNECAAILNCTAYSLYKSMQNLEKRLVNTVRETCL